ncbi:M2 family metallopeptidase [Fulvivirga lutea]|uniref:M2 family metallopeptidase n=1 Tax=Fulvivirga lutea TaxID=2810512 RepID=A0A975A1D6_9BACT|nr:M2 family metallopeptidase [Fulvivirga lutea]QSE98125.1 M2 family metallopeptidase [Fulvivirga lutea]
MFKYRLLTFIMLCFLISCNQQDEKQSNIKSDAQEFIDNYTQEFLRLYYNSAKAEWESNTHIVEGDTLNAYYTQKANEALADFTGSESIITSTRAFLDKREELDALQVKQLEAILYAAANNPSTAKEIVNKRIKAETVQNEKLFGFDFKIDGKSVSPNEIDRILGEETDIKKRQAAWEASKEVGKTLKEGLAELKDLRNQTVQALGYQDYFNYQVSDYGMTTEEMVQLNKKLISDVWPLYRELHTWARYELAEKYGQEVPDMLPAHWLPNRWGQDWSGLVNVEGIDLDSKLEEKGSEWLVKQAERFYVSLGFEELPQSFYDSSSMYPAPEGADYKKNNHASAWHMDLQKDIRCLMSVVPTAEWYETTHHELGHIYYYVSYTNPDVPPLLRGGANRGFHEAIGSMLGLAAMQKPFLENLELIPSGVETDETQTLLKEALNYVVFIPFSAGVMTHFEQDLYVNNLSKDEYNKAWWQMKKDFQGIVPPTERGEEYADATSKTHINNDAAQYYDYALSYVLLFQVHNHIAKNILKQDPRATNYYGNKEVGKFLNDMLKVGATKDWRELLKETTGEELNAKAMLDYFSPLTKYLKEENKGRIYTLPEKAF